MPLPAPKKNEKKQEFISRCIKEMTLDESERFPTRSQRAAICYSQWGETPEERRSTRRPERKNRLRKLEKAENGHGSTHDLLSPC